VKKASEAKKKKQRKSGIKEEGLPGQEEESGTDTDEDGQLIKSTAAEAAQVKVEEPPKPVSRKRMLGEISPPIPY
jgi:hypothetical protein